MATYEVNEEVPFVRQVIRTNPDRVINIDEKGRITAVAPDGSYSVQLLSDDPPVTGITDDDLEPNVALPGDSLPTDSTTHPLPSPADRAKTAPDTQEE